MNGLPNGGGQRTPWDVLWDLREAHYRLKRSAAEKEAARINYDLDLANLDRLESELLPLLPEDGDIRRWRIGTSEHIEACRSGREVSTEIIEPESAHGLSWPTPIPAEAAVAVYDEEVA